MDVDTFVRRIPKVELHNHIIGAMRLETALDLAKKNSVPTPPGDPAELYEYDNLIDFLTAHVFVSNTVQKREDFARVAYECLEDAYRSGNVRYSELFINPTNHMDEGIGYEVLIDGFIDGLRQAEEEFGVQARLIPSINRQESVAKAQNMLDLMIEHRRDEVIGLGIDHHELPFPPEHFADIYIAAGKAGFRRTAHTSHDAPATWINTCLDLLGCDRIDHGYKVIQDPEVLKRVRDEGVPFTCCMTTAQEFWKLPENDEPGAALVHPVKVMVEQGVNVTLGSDDPTMFHTDQGNEYVKYVNDFAFTPQQAVDVAFAALDGSWLDDSEKKALRSSFEAEVSELKAESGI
jgi:adenosine deaminase